MLSTPNILSIALFIALFVLGPLLLWLDFNREVSSNRWTHYAFTACRIVLFSMVLVYSIGDIALIGYQVIFLTTYIALAFRLSEFKRVPFFLDPTSRIVHFSCLSIFVATLIIGLTLASGYVRAAVWLLIASSVSLLIIWRLVLWHFVRTPSHQLSEGQALDTWRNLSKTDTSDNFWIFFDRYHIYFPTSKLEPMLSTLPLPLILDFFKQLPGISSERHKQLIQDHVNLREPRAIWIWGMYDSLSEAVHHIANIDAMEKKAKEEMTNQWDVPV